MVPIKNTSAKGLHNLYLAIIEGYINTIKIFLGVARSITLNVCAKFGLSISDIFLFIYFNYQEA